MKVTQKEVEILKLEKKLTLWYDGPVSSWSKRTKMMAALKEIPNLPHLKEMVKKTEDEFFSDLILDINSNSSRSSSSSATEATFSLSLKK
jgi:hypothetical protein